MELVDGRYENALITTFSRYFAGVKAEPKAEFPRAEYCQSMPGC